MRCYPLIPEVGVGNPLHATPLAGSARPIRPASATRPARSTGSVVSHVRFSMWDRQREHTHPVNGYGHCRVAQSVP